MAITPQKSNGWLILIITGIIGVLGLAVFFLFQSGDYEIIADAWLITTYLWWLILPVPIWYLFSMVWDEYATVRYLSGVERVLLEIRPPADIEKGPKIMEQIFAGLHTYSSINKFEKYCSWRTVQDTFSFEIASIEGRVHFYVRCPKGTRNNVEAQIYAQYPDAEINEAEDYTKKVPQKLPNKDWDVWGTSLKLFNKDAIPIRIYRQFKEDISGEMVDPFASLTEVLGSFGKNQHGWVQIIFQPVAEPDWHPEGEKVKAEIMGITKESGPGKIDAFFSDMREIFSNIFTVLSGKEPEFASAVEEKKTEFNIQRLSPGQQEKLKAIEENLSKTAFRTGIRVVYLGKRENFDRGLGVGGIMGAIKQFADSNLNSLMPDNRTKTFALYFFTKSRLAYRQRKIIQNYRDRDFAGATFVFNTEELATVYHFPDISVKTPAIDRIDAKKGQAPTNLPIGEL